MWNRGNVMSDGFNWNRVLGEEEKKQKFPTDGSSALKPEEVPAEGLKSFEESEDKLGHYRPAHVDQDVHSIELSDGRFNHEENPDLAPNQLEALQADATPVANVHMDDILRMAIERKASDIHLTAGLPPMIRLDGELVPLPYSILQASDTQRLVYDTLTEDHLQKFEQTHE